MAGPAASYADITREVGEIVGRHSGNDRTRAAYMVMRAACLIIRGERGEREAAERVYTLADEMTGGPT